MQEEFWQARWARREIGFHQAQVNPALPGHWSTLGLAPGSRVLVPLCGKSLDMHWLLQQGYAVTGVELAEAAVLECFAELGVQPEVQPFGVLRRYRHAALEIFQGDVFAMQAEQVAECQALYDRAALIALPPEMRSRYVQHLSAILPAAVEGLLVTLEYPQEQLDGPPFSVPAVEVRRQFGGWQVEECERSDVLAENGKFVARGVSSLDEVVYHLRRG